jgi:phosphotransferase system enzyme I (PtsI)
MKIYKGIVASQGIILGSSIEWRRHDYLSEVPDKCSISDIESEIQKIRNAHKLLSEELEKLKETAIEEEKELIDAEIMILETIVEEAEDHIRNEKICAELAVKKIYEKYAKLFKESGSELINLRLNDLRDLSSKLISYMMKIHEKIEKEYRGKIVIAEEMYPLDLALLLKHGIRGIITRRGGVTSHVAILARTYGIPYVISPNIEEGLNGKEIILDAIEGIVIIDPDKETLNKYRDLARKYDELKEKLRKEAFMEAITIDGFKVKVLCNIGSVEEARIANENGCEGIGLLRTEFLYMERNTPPSEKEIIETLKRIIEFVRGEVIIRAPDIGADKPVGFIKFEKEDNPQLGLRGIRLLLKYKEVLLKPLLRAYLKLNNIYGERVKLMLPMVSLPEELEEFNKILIETIEDLKNEGIKESKPIIGIMVETPSAANSLDLLIKALNISFISIGTNDLTQYVLAVDRGNPLVSNLYNELHPSVLRVIYSTVEIAKKLNLEVSVCGEMANKVPAIPLLIGMGINKLSVPLSLVGRTKYIIRRISYKEARKIVDHIIKYSTKLREVYDVAENFLKKNSIELIY